jgi:hypothetical protein
MKRKQGPPGMAWCGGRSHRKFLEVSAFNHDSSRWNGLDSMCAQCRAKAREKAKNRRKKPKPRGGCISASKARRAANKLKKLMRRY